MLRHVKPFASYCNVIHHVYPVCICVYAAERYPGQAKVEIELMKSWTVVLHMACQILYLHVEFNIVCSRYYFIIHVLRLQEMGKSHGRHSASAIASPITEDLRGSRNSCYWKRHSLGKYVFQNVQERNCGSGIENATKFSYVITFICFSSTYLLTSHKISEA